MIISCTPSHDDAAKATNVVVCSTLLDYQKTMSAKKSTTDPSTAYRIWEDSRLASSHEAALYTCIARWTYCFTVPTENYLISDGIQEEGYYGRKESICSLFVLCGCHKSISTFSLSDEDVTDATA